MDTIKVLVVEDMEPILRRYCQILSRDGHIDVVGAAQNGYQAVMLAVTQKPDVILMDIEMEDKEAGLRASAEILRQMPDIKIIMLTVYEEDELILKAFQLGAVDYILKDASPQEIVTGVKDAYYGRSPIRPIIAEKLRRELKRTKAEEKDVIFHIGIVSQLTHTELDILTLLNQGKSRREICELRNVELSTVKSQIHSILKKLNMDSVSSALVRLNAMHFFEILETAKTR